MSEDSSMNTELSEPKTCDGLLGSIESLGKTLAENEHSKRKVQQEHSQLMLRSFYHLMQLLGKDSVTFEPPEIPADKTIAWRIDCMGKITIEVNTVLPA